VFHRLCCPGLRSGAAPWPTSQDAGQCYEARPEARYLSRPLNACVDQPCSWFVLRAGARADGRTTIPPRQCRHKIRFIMTSPRQADCLVGTRRTWASSNAGRGTGTGQVPNMIMGSDPSCEQRASGKKMNDAATKTDSNGLFGPPSAPRASPRVARTSPKPCRCLSYPDF